VGLLGFLGPAINKIANYHLGLSIEVEREMQQSLWKNYPLYIEMFGTFENLPFVYHDTYNGVVALQTHSFGGPHIGWEVIINDVYFFTGWIIDEVSIWKEGQLYELEYAYEQGWLDRKDLMSIAYNFYSGRVYLVDEDGKIYLFEDYDYYTMYTGKSINYNNPGLGINVR
jgi:hypothetical protein